MVLSPLKPRLEYWQIQECRPHEYLLSFTRNRSLLSYTIYPSESQNSGVGFLSRLHCGPFSLRIISFTHSHGKINMNMSDGKWSSWIRWDERPEDFLARVYKDH